MIEIRTYEDDAVTAANFTRKVWTDRYVRSIPVIDWNADYFEWQLLWDRPGGRDFLVAAYDGQKLVGTLFAEPLSFQLRGQPISATMGSWLTVDPEYRGHGIATRLAEEQRKRHREHDAKFMLGFGVLGTDGPKFWEKRPDTHVLGTVGFWVRVFDPKRVAEWAPTLRDRMAARIFGPLRSGRPEVKTIEGIRSYTATDLDRCLELVRELEGDADMGYRFTRERLAHQLERTSMVRTWVLEQHGRVEGVVNAYLVGMTGRSFMPVAVFDLLAFGALSREHRQALLNRALAELADAGAGLAMTLRIPCYRAADLWEAGFVPTPKDSNFLCTVVDPKLSLAGVRGLLVHWR